MASNSVSLVSSSSTQNTVDWGTDFSSGGLGWLTLPADASVWTVF
jgi:hypothetical protein